MFRRVFSALDQDGLHPVGGFDWDGQVDNVVATCEGLAAKTPFLAQMRALLRLLRERIGMPVDIEFAHDGTDLYLLQCRPQSSLDAAAPAPIPRDIPAERVVFTARRYVSNGQIADITDIVYVDAEQYARIGDLETLRDVGRAVGRLNKALPKRQFVLIGPGRWGSRGDIKLGVSVTYSDINNTAVLMEVAEKRGGYVPELSFGTHFFQDLVESAIRYLPLYPDESGIVFNRSFLMASTNRLAELVPEYAELADVLHVVHVPEAAGGQVLKILMNADQDEAIGFLAAPGT